MRRMPVTLSISMHLAAIWLAGWPLGVGRPAWGEETPASADRPFRKLSGEQLAQLNKEAEEIAKGTQKPAVVVPHVEKGPAIDGELKEDFCQKAAKISLVKNGGENEKLEQQYGTEVYLLTDPQYLYLAFRCDDKVLKKDERVDPLETVFKWLCAGAVRERDQAVSEDDHYVEFVLEPGMQRKDDDYFHIAVNTLGTLYDAFERDEINWDPGTKVAVKPCDDYYVIELAIPLASLIPRGQKFPRLWAANFLRLRPQQGELAWNRTPKTHLPEKFGTLVFALGMLEP
jgi:hypothetical protein